MQSDCVYCTTKQRNIIMRFIVPSATPSPCTSPHPPHLLPEQAVLAGAELISDTPPLTFSDRSPPPEPCALTPTLEPSKLCRYPGAWPTKSPSQDIWYDARSHREASTCTIDGDPSESYNYSVGVPFDNAKLATISEEMMPNLVAISVESPLPRHPCWQTEEWMPLGAVWMVERIGAERRYGGTVFYLSTGLEYSPNCDPSKPDPGRHQRWVGDASNGIEVAQPGPGRVCRTFTAWIPRDWIPWAVECAWINTYCHDADLTAFWTTMDWDLYHEQYVDAFVTYVSRVKEERATK